jgi:hypothetical protein
VFDELRQSIKDIENLLDPTVSEVRIGSTGTLNMGIVPAVIEKITRQHPRASFHVVESDLVTLQRELRDRNVDLLIGRAPTQLLMKICNLRSFLTTDCSLWLEYGTNGPAERKSRLRISSMNIGFCPSLEPYPARWFQLPSVPPA